MRPRDRATPVWCRSSPQRLWCGVDHRSACGDGTASVIVEEHERDVVPVLRFASRVRGGALGQQETGKTGDVDLGGLLLATIEGTQRPDLVILSRFTAPSRSHPSSTETEFGIADECASLAERLDTKRRHEKRVLT